MGLLASNGILNQFLRDSGLAADPGTILGTEWAVHLGIVYAYLPFMVLPLYATLEKLDASPARGGVRPRRRPAHRLPHRHPAAVAARHRRRLPAGLIPALGEFVIPDLLGGADTLMIGKVAVGRVLPQFGLAARLGGGDLPAGPAGGAHRPLPAPAGQEPGAPLVSGRPRFAFTVLAFGYAFLYLPIALVIVYSFNESRMVTVWAGFSTRWWSALFANEAMLRAAWLSLRIAFVSATAAAVIGLAAGYVLARVPRFLGRTLFGSLVIAPMVMPEVVMGISMLLLFVGSDRLLGGPERGFLTIAIAHITFSTAFVAVVVQARLADFDRSLEEAAMDLGATPWVTFLTVTLPLIAPAVGSGWLLAFTLSLDDLILTQFVAGAQSQTLPMRVYSSVRLGVDPQINALATIIVAVAARRVDLFRMADAPESLSEAPLPAHVAPPADPAGTLSWAFSKHAIDRLIGGQHGMGKKIDN